MRRLWLIFAQTVTFCVAVLFVVQTLKPEWLARNSAQNSIAEIREAAPVHIRQGHRLLRRCGAQSGAGGGA